MCWENSIKLPEMKILSAFCVFLYADRQTDRHGEANRHISRNIHLKHSTKRDDENENCRYEYFMKLGLVGTAFHMSK
jgi:hypothetical protein